jgi:hypothetical protein
MKRHVIVAFCVAVGLLGMGIAVWRLGGHKPAFNDQPLSYWLKQVETGNYYRFGTADALQAIGAPAAEPLMQVMTKTHDGNVQMDARSALASLGIALAGQEQALRRLQTHHDAALREDAKFLLYCLQVSRLQLQLDGTAASGRLSNGR